MKAFHDYLGLVCETFDGSTIDDDVGSRNRLALVQSPDMKFMNRLDTRDLSQHSSSAFIVTATEAETGACTYHFDIVLDIIRDYFARSSLQQDAAAVPRQWPSGQENHDRDENANCRIGIESRFSMGFPYDES